MISLLVKEDYERNVNEIQDYSVKLEPDPITVGLVTFHRKLSEATAYHERVSTLMLEAIMNETEYEILTTTVTKIHQDALEKIYRNDEDIVKLKSKELREAAANACLVKEAQALADVRGNLLRAKSYKKQLQVKLDSLENTYKGLNHQLDNIRMQLRMGELTRTDWDRFVSPVEPGMKQLHLEK